MEQEAISKVKSERNPLEELQTELCLEIIDGSKQQKASQSGFQEIHLYYKGSYEPGDGIRVSAGNEPCFLWIQLDEVLGEELVYYTGTFTYLIPFEEKRRNLSPKVFTGDQHLLSIRMARTYELSGYRNLSANVYDQHGLSTLYPHAKANVETRGESVFAAQNAINRNTANASHGAWPYESWGINMQDDARIRIDFGRTICTDRIVLYTRADFPHDNWWTKVRFRFSDGEVLSFPLEKQVLPHELTFERRNTSWIEMENMIKADDPSPFPALTQMKVFGWEEEGG